MINNKIFLILSYLFVLLIPVAAIVSYIYPNGSPFELLLYPWLILIIISYVFFFIFQLKKEDLSYGKMLLHWLTHSVVFTIAYFLVHTISVSIFQIINYRWYSDMVGAELIFIFPGIILVNIIILIVRISKKKFFS